MELHAENEASANELTANALRHGLAQMLRTYSSAGIKRFHRSTDVELPAVLLGTSSNQSNTTPAAGLKTNSPGNERTIAVSAAPVSSQEAAHPVIAPVISSTSATSSHADVAATASAPVTPRTVAASPLLQIAPGPWPLPSLPLENRQSMLGELNEQVVACRKCEDLVCYRRQTVFGEGNLQPRICFYGEAPGADEDAQGRPFVGAAGRLLTDIIRAMRLTREEVYILNSLKCRPPQNRTPLPEEVENCRAYGLTQLAILQPEFIILLGAVAARSVLQTSESVGRLRGRFHSYQHARVLVTYHPAYLLRNADAKKLVWADVQMVMREIGTLPKPS